MLTRTQGEKFEDMFLVKITSKGCLDLRGLVGFLTKTIQKRVKIKKVASICVV